MTDAIEDVAHIAPAAITDRLEELGADTIVAFYDVLSHGPSREEPSRHREVRLEYWHQLYRKALGGPGREAYSTFESALHELEESYVSTEQLGSIASHWADRCRLVIWTTPAFQDRLLMWMVFEALQRADVPAERVATAEPHLPTPDGETYRPLRELTSEELFSGFEDIIYPKDLYVDAGAQLWQTFSSASPRKFAISIPHTEKFFPEIATLGERYGWMFPVQHGDSSDRMWPSRLDTELLGTLERGQWRTPLEVLGAECVETFGFIDDLALVARLQEWVEEADDPPYVRVRATDRNELFEHVQFQITERGERLIEEGFEPFDDAPIAEIGSARAYAGDQPWVKVIEGEHWWFARFERGE